MKISKNILLKYKYFIDNEFLDEYCELINENILTVKKKNLTQSHHVIPVAYYKIIKFKNTKGNNEQYQTIKKIAENDKNNFCVNLNYENHIKAHYLLFNCTTGNLKYINANAVFHVIGNINFQKNLKYEEIKNFIYSKFNIDEIRNYVGKERSKKYTGKIIGKKISEKQKDEISKANGGNIYIRKKIDGCWVIKKVKSLEQYYESVKNGWEHGIDPEYKEKASKKISDKKRGSICINNGIDIKYVQKENLKNFIENGWKIGYIKPNHKKITVVKLNRKKSINIELLEKHIDWGWCVLNE